MPILRPKRFVKAHPGLTGAVVPSTVIAISAPFPAALLRKNPESTMGEDRAYYRAEAVRFCDAIRMSMPGGLFDAIAAEMCARQASALRVTYHHMETR